MGPLKLLENKKSSLDEIKSIFHSFEGLSFRKKIKNSGFFIFSPNDSPSKTKKNTFYFI